MPNENKIKIVKKIEEKFKNSSGLYFTKYTGMNVAQATKLRKSFKENSVEYRVSKNTLTKIAAINAGYDEGEINKFLDGQIGIAYSDSDPTAPAKVIKDFKKDNEDCLDVVGLIFEGEFFEPEKYKTGEAEINDALADGFEVIRDFETGGGIVMALGKWEKKDKVKNEWTK